MRNLCTYSHLHDTYTYLYGLVFCEEKTLSKESGVVSCILLSLKGAGEGTGVNVVCECKLFTLMLSSISYFFFFPCLARLVAWCNSAPFGSSAVTTERSGAALTDYMLNVHRRRKQFNACPWNEEPAIPHRACSQPLKIRDAALYTDISEHFILRPPKRPSKTLRLRWKWIPVVVFFVCFFPVTWLALGPVFRFRCKDNMTAVQAQQDRLEIFEEFLGEVCMRV